jgi:hypothetical protein
MPSTAFTKTAYPNGGNIKGDVYALSSPDGTGVIFKVKLSGLPSEGGPFSKPRTWSQALGSLLTRNSLPPPRPARS